MASVDSLLKISVYDLAATMIRCRADTHMQISCLPLADHEAPQWETKSASQPSCWTRGGSQLYLTLRLLPS